MIEHILLALAGFIKAVDLFARLSRHRGSHGHRVGLHPASLRSHHALRRIPGLLRTLPSLAMVATLGAIGCNLGSVLAYEVGAYGGRPLIERFGKYILMNRHDLDVSDTLLPEVRQHHGLSSDACSRSCAPSSPCPPESPACRAASSTSTPLPDPGPGATALAYVGCNPRRSLGYRSPTQALAASLRRPHRAGLWSSESSTSSKATGATA